MDRLLHLLGDLAVPGLLILAAHAVVFLVLWFLVWRPEWREEALTAEVNLPYPLSPASERSSR